ncbi:GTPase-associated protein 1-related protein [Actinoplanes subtropicus]|uniref:GTPase-associated protein 1-related protein n=1 Tax=Actinoplanes subtropicus TaxID=543632 RepID=UPI000690F820|nr:GTPase-associated protein 1-related protein [Actinoplanes subtropicus]
MGAAQMYYTSCEAGLAGYPGFQFNAATPGVDPVVMRRVEQGTSYEPPRSAGYQPTAEQMARFPVNLCYLPGDDGEPAVLANTVFIGTDYSQRFGNYFVHALSLPSIEDDLGSALPIDFWRAGFWARTEAARTDLPELDPVPPCSSGPAASEEFLQIGPGRQGRLPQLLTAVEHSMIKGERSVVIVEADSDRVAGWISAVSHLLPPAMSRRLSFSTYSFRPGRSAEHVIGTVPDTDFVVDDTTLRGYFLFDFPGDHFTPVVAHPLAEMLAAMDVRDGAEVWSLAEPLRSGAERGFDDWYPLAAAGALRAGIGVSAGDVAAVVGWLAGNAARLRPMLASELVHRCFDHAGLRADGAAALVGIAAGAGDDDLLATAEVRAFALLVDELPDAAAPADVPRPVTPDGIAQATDLITRRLAGSPPGPAATTVLTVAVRAGLRFDRPTLEHWGRELLAPALLAGTDDRVPGLLGSLPHSRRTVLESLSAALPRQRPAVLAATARLAEVVRDEELVSYPELHRAILLARAAGEPEERVPTLKRLAASGLPDGEMLTALWPGEWTVADAAEVVAAVPGAYWRSPAMVARIDAVLRRTEAPRGESAWANYKAICEFAGTRPVSEHLSDESLRHVGEMRRARAAIANRARAKGSEPRKILLDLVAQAKQAKGPARRFLESYLPQALLRVDALVLADVLPRAPEPVRTEFCRLATQVLRAKQPDLALAGALFEMRAEMSGRDRLAADFDQVLAESVAQWRSRDLDRLAEWVDSGPVNGSSGYFRKWREGNARRGIGRFLPRRRG